MFGFFFGLLLIAVIFSVTGSSCECVQNRYTFTIPYSCSPQKDSVQVGDTIWLTSTATTKMVDLKTSEIKSVINAPIGMDIMLLALTEPGLSTGALPDFDFVVVDGTRVAVPSIVADKQFSIKFAFSGSSYSLKMGYVCKTKGLYSILISGVGNIRPQGYSQCDAATFLYPNNNSDNHLYILQNTYYRGTTIDQASAQGSYSFKVY